MVVAAVVAVMVVVDEEEEEEVFACLLNPSGALAERRTARR
jgi:hypothetical protein